MTKNSANRKQKWILWGTALLFSAFLIPATASASAMDRCYSCGGGKYVRYVGKDDLSKRSKAKKCGCTVKGTAGCPSAKKKIVCTVSMKDANGKAIACKGAGKKSAGKKS